MMNCSETNRLMTVYMDGELDDILARQFEEHVASCPQCREELEHIKMVVGLCADMPEDELPQDFPEKLHRKLMEAAIVGKSSKRSEIIRRKYIKICSSIAAGLIMFLVLGGLYERIGGNFPHYSRNDTNSAAKSTQSISGSAEDSRDTLSSANTENSEKNKKELSTADTAQSASTAADATAENRANADMAVESAGDAGAYKMFAGNNEDWQADNTAESTTKKPDTCTQLQERTLDGKRPLEDQNTTTSPPPSGQTDEYDKSGTMSDGGSGSAEENKSINVLLRTAKIDVAEAFVKTTSASNGGGVVSEMQAVPQTSLSIQSGDMKLAASALPPKDTQPSKNMQASNGSLPPSDINMKIKLPAKNFENFMSALRSTFEPADIETGAVYNTDLELRINGLEKERMDINRKIADLESGSAVGAPDELEFLKSENIRLQDEIDRLKKACETVIVYITIRKK